LIGIPKVLKEEVNQDITGGKRWRKKPYSLENMIRSKAAGTESCTLEMLCGGLRRGRKKKKKMMMMTTTMGSKSAENTQNDGGTRTG
jgi:hypothetical protein